MPLRLIVAYGLILVMVGAATFAIVRVRRRAAEQRSLRRGHRVKGPR